MERAEWMAKMALGWLCYWPVLWCPWHAMSSNSKVFMLALSWAGFYAYDAGFNEWRQRKSSNAKLTGEPRSGESSD